MKGLGTWLHVNLQFIQRLVEYIQSELCSVTNLVPRAQLHIPLDIAGVEVEARRFGAFEFIFQESKGALEGEDAACFGRQRHLRRAPP